MALRAHPRSIVLAAALLLGAACAPTGQPRSAATEAPAGATASPAATPIPTGPLATPTVLASPITMPTFAQVVAPSRDVVWALVAGAELFRSTDHGATWQQRPMPVVSGRSEVSFVDDHEGWDLEPGSTAGQCAAQPVSIWHTADAGASWERLAADGIADAQCKTGLAFADAAHGFLTAYTAQHTPSLYRTSDGGRSWAAPSPLPVQGDSNPGPVHAFGTTLLLPAGRSVYRSTDGGATWATASALPTGATSVAFVTATRWLQLITPDQSQETLDGGATWHAYGSTYSQAAPVPPQVVFGDSQVGYATVRGELQRTLDGGLHWASLRTPGTS